MARQLEAELRGDLVLKLLDRVVLELFDAAAPTCVACHAPVTANFVDDPHALLPLDAAPPGREAALDSGDEAVFGDGVGCIVCHTQPHPLAEGAAARVRLWQLAPLLVHTILFGGGYGSSVRAAALAYL